MTDIDMLNAQMDARERAQECAAQWLCKGAPDPTMHELTSEEKAFLVYDQYQGE